MGTPISGKNGSVLVGATEIGDVESWELDDVMEGQAYASNSTAGRRKRIAGIGDLTGRIVYKLDTAAALPLAPGDSVTLDLEVDATHHYEVQVYIESVGTVVNVETGAITAQTAEFSGNGTITRPTFGS